jgi:uncharacterized protein
MLCGAPAMSFNEDRQLETSQVEDLRGGSPLTHVPGGGLAVGGGVGLIVALLAALFGGGVT